MSRHRFDHRFPTDNFTVAGPVMRDRVHARTEELAMMAGRAPQDATLDDYAQAKRELTGQADAALQDAILAAAPETGRSDEGSRLTPERPLLSERGLRHRLATFRVADLVAIETERNRLPYRRMFS